MAYQISGAKTFRSTGSYEPDPIVFLIFILTFCFDPQALTSLTGPDSDGHIARDGFDPQALTSLTLTT